MFQQTALPGCGGAPHKQQLPTYHHIHHNSGSKVQKRAGMQHQQQRGAEAVAVHLWNCNAPTTDDTAMTAMAAKY